MSHITTKNSCQNKINVQQQNQLSGSFKASLLKYVYQAMFTCLFIFFILNKRFRQNCRIKTVE